MSLEIIGFQELLKKMQRISFDAPVATAFGLYEGGQRIMENAKDRAPKDTTALARSGYVTPPEVRAGAHITLDMGFGGEAGDYAVKAHEDMTMPHPRGGEAKYFTNALDAGRKLLFDTIKRHVDTFLKTGRTNPVRKIVPASPWEDRV